MRFRLITLTAGLLGCIYPSLLSGQKLLPDSLYLKWKTALHDTQKLQALSEISYFYLPVNVDSSIYYARLEMNIAANTNPYFKGVAAYDLGRSLVTANRLVEALTQFNEVKKIGQENNIEELVLFSLGDIAQVYAALNDEKKLLEVHEQVCREAGKKHPEVVVNAIRLMAMWYSKMENPYQTLYYLRQLDQMDNHLTDSLNYYLDIKTRARANLQLNHKDSAYAMAILAERFFARNRHIILHNETVILKAQIRYMQGYFDRAMAIIDNADTAILSPNRQLHIYYLNTRYKIDSALGNIASALKHLSLLQQFRMESNAKETALKVNNLESLHQLKEANLQLSAEKANRRNDRNFLISLLAGCILIILVAVFFFYFLRKLQRKRMREQQLQLEKSKLKSELKALKSQLDTHFLQNTFQLLSYSLHKHSVEYNTQLLKKISAYIRQILNMSDRPVISLEEELDFTNNYLEMSQAITGYNFQFFFHIPDSLDLFGIKVPAMLLQPIVENAIKHGLHFGTINGQVHIGMHEEGKWLKIRIANTGLLEVENASSSLQKGMEIVRKKLALLPLHTPAPDPVQGIDKDRNEFFIIITLPCFWEDNAI